MYSFNHMHATLQPASSRSGKKYTVRIGDRHISFGMNGASDFTMHKDPLRKRAYIQRHSKREDWSNPLTAGFWAKNLLWSETTIPKAIAKIKKRFGITIINKL